MNQKDKGVVSVLSLAASALAVVCFVTGRMTLSEFLGGHSSALPAAAPIAANHPAPLPSPAAAALQTEQMLSQAAFFVHYGHLPGHGTDDYDADDNESDKQALISRLEEYIASAPAALQPKSTPQQKQQLARAQSLRHALGLMKSPPS